MNKIYLVFGLLWLWINTAGAVTFIASEETVDPASSVTVPITITDFNNVTSIQFTLTWDATVIDYDSTADYGLNGINSGSFGETSVDNGRLTFLWIDPMGGSASLPDNSVLFSVSYTGVGRAGESSTIQFGDTPLQRQVTVDLVEVDFLQDNGRVTIEMAGNQPPQANNDQATIAIDSTNVEINVLANDIDPDGSIDPATVTITDDPSHGTISIDSMTGVVTYTTDEACICGDTFTYTVNDNEGDVSNEAVVTINAVNYDISGDGNFDVMDIQSLIEAWIRILEERQQ